MPIALTERSGVELLSGNLAGAMSMVTEAAAVIAATDSDISPYGAVWMATWRGRETQAGTLVDAGRPDVVRRGEGLWLISTDWATANLLNGRGRYEEALAAAQRATEQPYRLGLSNGWVAHELIEAAARSGRLELATEALARLSEVAQASGTDRALGVEARCRALLSEGDVAERLYREAVERLSRTRIRVALARAHLLYGEWLRRAGRRLDAREQLRTAHLMFTEIGMEAFAERTRRELLATGETARKRTVETVDELTAQETQIAQLTRNGLSNAEIAAELFISPRTVEWHLRKVFTKLGISSRRQLRGPRPGF
jgi:DNA-binding CsgD family transcriptional regulator